MISLCDELIDMKTKIGEDNFNGYDNVNNLFLPICKKSYESKIFANTSQETMFKKNDKLLNKIYNIKNQINLKKNTKQSPDYNTHFLKFINSTKTKDKYDYLFHLFIFTIFIITFFVFIYIFFFKNQL